MGTPHEDKRVRIAEGADPPTTGPRSRFSILKRHSGKPALVTRTPSSGKGSISNRKDKLN